MERRKKVELFEQIRRQHEFGGVSIRELARHFGVHRRMVRQALKQALPPERKSPQRFCPKLQPVKEFIDQILETDKQAPRKQRHTAHRIYVRIQQETTTQLSEASVRRYVRLRKQQLGLAKGEIFIPQSYAFAQEAQVDWYEGVVDLDGQRLKVQVFSMRSMASGGAFHVAYPRATQQAFFEAHLLAFDYFGGVFQTLRFDNLSSAVKKILRGHTRQENIRFIALRSHYRFQAQFCNPAKGNEKGGVEGEVGYFRRNHLVPVPKAKDFADLNEQLLAACQVDQQRLIGQREVTVGVGMEVERQHLLALPEEPFEIAEVSFPKVDAKGCVKVRTNFYSTPLAAGTTVRVRLLPAEVEIFDHNRLVSRHPRSYGRSQQVLNLEDYLHALERKPGAFANSTALQQWREQGRWPVSFDRLWQSLQLRFGKAEGTREMIELLLLGRKLGSKRLQEAVEKALSLGCTDAAAVRYLLQEDQLEHKKVETLRLQELEQYDRPQPSLSSYDQLLALPGGQEVGQ
jgi:transposase